MQKRTILIVDDSDFNRHVIADILNDDYNIIEATNGIEAIDYIFKKYKEIALIILDIMMPQLNGIEVMKIIKSDERTVKIPVIMLTAADSNEEYCFKLGAIDFIKKPFNQNVVLSRVNAHISSLCGNNLQSDEKNDPCFNMFLDILYKMMAIPDLNTLYSLEQIDRCRNLSHIFIAEVCQVLKKDYGILSRDIDKISSLIPLRDIGKFLIKKEILQKKDKLTEKEFDEIKKHCEYGLKILEPFSKDRHSYCTLLADIIENHHENFDGTGYPNSKKGKEISPSGRVAAIIDCYAAMTEERAYRASFSHEETIEYIISQKNKKFDGHLVDIFVKLPLKKHI